MKAEAVEQRDDAGACVLRGLVENAIRLRCFNDLHFRGLADYGFEIWIGWDKQAGGARIDARTLVIDTAGQHFGCRQMDVNRVAMHRHVTGFELAEIDARDDLSMSDE